MASHPSLGTERGRGYSRKKKGRNCIEVVRNGTTLATFEGKKEGRLTLASGQVFKVTHDETLSLPGSTMLNVFPEGSGPVVSAGSSWNLIGFAKTEVVIEPDGLTGDDLWATIFLLTHSVVIYSLWQVPKEIGATIFVAGRMLR